MTIVRVRKGEGGSWEVVDCSRPLSLGPPSLGGLMILLDSFYHKAAILLAFLLVPDMVALVFLVLLCRFRRVGGGRGL